MLKSNQDTNMKKAIINKKALFDYEIIEKYEAGIQLVGTEVKSIKNGRINLIGSFVTIKGNEMFLTNAKIPPYQPRNAPIDYNSTRPRKLLLTRKEISRLIGKIKEKNLTILPLKVYTIRGKIKIRIGVGRGKKKFEKRELIKKRESERNIRHHLRKGM